MIYCDFFGWNLQAVKRHLSVKLVMLHHPIFICVEATKQTKDYPESVLKTMLISFIFWFGFFLFTEKHNKCVDR